MWTLDQNKQTKDQEEEKWNEIELIINLKISWNSSNYSLIIQWFFSVPSMCVIWVFPLHFTSMKKRYGTIRNIFTKWCFDPSSKREQGGWCYLFWDKDSKEKEKEIITVTLKIHRSYFIMEKTKTFFVLSMIRNIIRNGA